jgi:hypothetical protein
MPHCPIVVTIEELEKLKTAKVALGKKASIFGTALDDEDSSDHYPSEAFGFNNNSGSDTKFSVTITGGRGSRKADGGELR